VLKIPRLFSNVMEFVPASLGEDEWERESAEERELRLVELGLRTGVGEVQFRPLEWSTAAPRRPGWYFVKKVDGHDYIAIELQAGDDFWPGLQFAGPLPTPRCD